MTVLIANGNEDIIKEFLPKVTFEKSTQNTSVFKVSPQQFEKVQEGLRKKGYNPFAVMAW